MVEPTQSWEPGVPEDREVSPMTGWTRDHWIATADHLLEGVGRHASPRYASIRIPGPHRSSGGAATDGLEGFARSLLLAAYRLAASDGHVQGDLVDRYCEGLRHGSSRRGEEAWPSIEHNSQTIVEAAFVALALAESRQWIWESLDDRTRQQLVDWLSGVHAKQTPMNNWVLFPVVVQAFLKSVGADHQQDAIDRNLDLVDSWYRRDGWYSDGAGQNFDYYNAWAIHFYTLMWSRLDPSDTARAEVYRDRLARFLEQYQFLFGANGAPLYQGRSLVYRFATAAPLWLGALVDSTPLAPGETRRVASGILRHFLDRGAVRDGVLTLGWYDEFPSMVQHYSGHGSPYWASKGFCGLLLGPTHPVWTDREEPMAVERGDFCVAMPAPGFLARGTAADGVVRVASHRSDHFPLPKQQIRPRMVERIVKRLTRSVGRPQTTAQPDYDVHYGKLSYSTHAGPGIEDADVDSQISMLVGTTERSRRFRIYCLGIADRFASSVYYPRDRARVGRIETATIAHGPFEVRVHHVAAPWGRALRDGGFAVASTDPPSTESGDGWASVRRRDGLTSVVLGLRGFDAAGAHPSRGSNSFGEYAAAPFVMHSGAVSPEAVFVSVVGLGVDGLDIECTRRVVTGLEVVGRQVVLGLDGEWWFLQLVTPEPVDRTLVGRRISGAFRAVRVSPDGTCFTVGADGQASM